MKSFKQFLSEAGAGLSGNIGTGTSLQRNRPGAQKVFSPPVTHTADLKHNQQEDLAWKQTIYSHILHMHSSGGFIEQNGRFFLPLDVILGYSDGRPWHEEAITELQNSNVFSKTLMPVSIQAYVLDKPPRNAYDMTNLIRQDGKFYIPADSIDQDELLSMQSQGWMSSTTPQAVNVKAYEVFPNNARFALARQADWRNTLNTFYGAMAATTEPTLKGTGFLTTGQH